MQKMNLPDGLGLRQATANDQAFIESLFHGTKENFYIAEQESDYVRMVIEQQLTLQTQGYGTQSPDAFTFIVEKQGTKIGRLVLDFGKNIAHIVDLALIKEARGKAYGKAVIQSVQHIAQQQGLPVGLSVEVQNVAVKQLYVRLGFQTHEQNASHEFMLWYPEASKVFG